MSQSPKKALLRNLRNDTYCRLGVSKHNGVGVIAIKKIPIYTDPFKTVYKQSTDSIELSNQEVQNLNPAIQRLVKDFFMKTPNNTYPVYYNGLNALDIAYYLNHSDDPNVLMVNLSPFNNEYYTFQTIKDIKSGEELTIDYFQHANSMEDIHSISEQFNLSTI